MPCSELFKDNINYSVFQNRFNDIYGISTDSEQHLILPNIQYLSYQISSESHETRLLPNSLNILVLGYQYIKLNCPHSNLEQLSANILIDNRPCLGKLRKLEIRSSSNLFPDLSCFGNLFYLNISSCDIEDVSTLGNVYKLDLTCCKKIVDVSALTKVHHLIIDHCTNVKDISFLNHVPILSLFLIDIANPLFGLQEDCSCKQIAVTAYENILSCLQRFINKKKKITIGSPYAPPTNLSAFLEGFSIVHLSGHRRRLDDLLNLKTLSFCGDSMLEIGNLPNLEELSISGRRGGKSIQLSYGTLEFSLLRSLRKLRLIRIKFHSHYNPNCKISGCPSLRYLQIDSPQNLENLTLEVNLDVLCITSNTSRFLHVYLKIPFVVDIISIDCNYAILSV
jgi:hypothetical protein